MAEVGYFVLGVVIGIILNILYVRHLRIRAADWPKKKVNTDDRISVRYLFVYKIIEGSPKSLPTEFLVNWKLRDLENHLYLLYLNLDEGLDIEEYLHKVWVGYSGNENIYGKVYKAGDIITVRNILIGTWEVVEGRIGYHMVPIWDSGNP